MVQTFVHPIIKSTPLDIKKPDSARYYRSSKFQYPALIGILSRHKTSEQTSGLNYITEQMGLTDICTLFYLEAIILDTSGTFSKLDHVLGHTTSQQIHEENIIK